MGPFQVLQLWAKVGLGAMAMKGYSAFPKAPAYLEQLIVSVNVRIIMFKTKNPPRLETLLHNLPNLFRTFAFV